MDKKVAEAISKYPRTRYMGSKQKLLKFIHENIKSLSGERALDAFSGSGAVAYLLKSMGKEVHANDFLLYSHMITKALVENNSITLNEKDINLLLEENGKHDFFVSKEFKDLYFTDDENNLIDQIYFNSSKLSGSKRSLALAALARACVKKRPRGVFTYVGNRYDDGRRDLKISLKDQFLESIDVLNNAVFDNGKKNKSYNKNVFDLKNQDYDLVYIDPPYCSLHSDNDYSRRYHFVEGLMSKWSHVSINPKTKTKKFDKFSSPFDSKTTIYKAFDDLFSKFQDSTLVVSYSSNSIPSLKEMIKLLQKYKKHVNVEKFSHKYSFGNQRKGIINNKVDEYLFIAKD